MMVLVNLFLLVDELFVLVIFIIFMFNKCEYWLVISFVIGFFLLVFLGLFVFCFL